MNQESTLPSLCPHGEPSLPPCAVCVKDHIHSTEAVYPHIPLDEAEMAAYKWQHNMGGSFMNHIYQAIALSDTEERVKLARAYPVEVAGISRFQNERGFADGIRRKGWDV